MPKVLIVIPVRCDSARIPGKPLRLLRGKSLIECVVEDILASTLDSSTHPAPHYQERIVVSTDSALVRKAVEHLIEVRMTSSLCQNGTERVAETLSQYPELESAESVVVNVQGDQVFMSREVIEGAVARVVENGDAVGTMVAPLLPTMLRNPDRVKVLLTEESGICLDFYRLREQGVVQSALGMLTGYHVGIYAYRPATLRQWVALSRDEREEAWGLEQLRPLAAKFRFGAGWVKSDIAPTAIDSLLDLQQMRQIVAANV